MGEYYGVRRADDDQHLEHWGVPKGWTKQGHKYLARLVSNTGKGYRYIYTQAELAAAKAGKLANNAGKAVAKATGLTARNRAQATARRADRYTHPTRKGQEHPDGRAARMARSTAKRAQAAYDKTLLGRAENAFNSARKAVGDAASEAGRQANKTYKAARKGVMNAAGDAQKYVNKQVGRAQKAYKDYQNFKKLPDWQKQIAVNADRKGVKKVMGRSVKGAAMASRLEGIENAIRGAARTVGRGANDAYRGARKGVMNAGKQISRTANDALDNVQRAANDVYKGARKTARKAGRAVEDATGVTAKRRLDRQRKRYYKVITSGPEVSGIFDPTKRSQAAAIYEARYDNADRAYSKAERDYNRTPLGRISNLGEGIGNAYSNLHRSRLVKFGNKRKTSRKRKGKK